MVINTLTRREFLKTSASAAMAGALFLGEPVFRPVYGKDKSRVVLVRDEAVLHDLNKPDSDILSGMLDKAVMELTGTDNPKAAWDKIIKPDDVVGIKTNAWHYLGTPKGLESAIEHRVLES